MTGQEIYSQSPNPNKRWILGCEIHRSTFNMPLIPNMRFLLDICKSEKCSGDIQNIGI